MLKSLAWLLSYMGASLRNSCNSVGWKPVRSLLPVWTAIFLLFPLAVPSQTAQENQEPISPLRPAEVADAAKIALGEALFGDARLSRNRAAACTSCHDLHEGGDDGRARSAGADGQSLDFNTPTVFNVGRNSRLNWRGNFRTLEEQNEAALLDPSLMNMDWGELLSRLRQDHAYAGRFAAAYDAAPDRENVLDALAAFQRSLVTPNSRFDRYLEGEPGALTADEERGYGLFKDYGCVACHQGTNIGGNLFQRFGIFADPFADQETIGKGDLGRLTVTGQERDRHVFRVPSLRNVALTAPYFHDGRTASLDEAVKIMARNQLGRELPDRDVRSIVRFLETLTGEYRGRPMARKDDGSEP